MSIPLPDLLRRHRASQWRRKLPGRRTRLAMAAWSWMVRRPGVYRRVNGLAVAMMNLLGRRRGAISAMPMAGAWTASRDLPTPAGSTFMQQWQKRGRQT